MNIKLKKTGPPLSERELQEFEEEMGYKLPEAYRSFLLAHNGGRPEPEFFIVPDWQYRESLVNEFKSIVPDGEGFGVRQIMEMKGDIFPEGFIPIGRDPGGNMILMSLMGESRENIYFWDHENTPDDRLQNLSEYSNMYFLAGSFEEFVNSLKKEDEL